ncbi:MAG TPA: hypothetical protein VMY76_07630 [Gemmatimonadales bacterium]|nr:hypothetical protein [Gemmatimonadales bacterium]
MRRLAVVASAVEGARDDRLGEWLNALPTSRVEWFVRVGDVPLAGFDVLWLRGAAETGARLLAWLRAGGRVLATHDGVLTSTALALESELPATTRLPDPPPPAFGLAGFGRHPLFSGLRDGALLRPRPGLAMRTYARHRLAAADVVAVRRHGLELQSDCVLAWEFPVEAGGMLCLGFEPHIPSGEQADGTGDAEIVLANALVGDAIPHRERSAPVVCWPAPGRRAVRGPSDGSGVDASTPDLSGDVWPSASLPHCDLAPSAGWTHAGRRLLVTAQPASGFREAWAPPFRIMREAAVRDAIPCAPGHIAADEVAGGLARGAHRLRERWLAAADVPALVWEIGGVDGIEVLVEWSVDFQRASPYPEGSYGDLSFDLAPDRRSVRVAAASGPGALYSVSGGTLSVEGSEERAVVRVSCSGTTPVRILVAAGADADERRRAVRVVEGGVRAMAAARTRKSTQLARYGTRFEAPDPSVVSGFEWARQRGDESLIGITGLGRSMLAACPPGAGEGAWCFGAQACAAAAAQLIAGNRDPAQELLKYLAQTQHPNGGIASHHPPGGLLPAPDAAGTVAYLRLAERVRAWTGALESFGRLRASLAAALGFLARAPETGGAPTIGLLDSIESLLDGKEAARALAVLRRRSMPEPSLGGVDPHAVVEAAAAALRRSPGALPGREAAPALLEAVAALWGLEPDAPDDALAVTPAVPRGWDGFALRGIRVARTVLDLEARRRPGAIIVRTTHRFGPRLVLSVGVRGVDVVATDVDDVALSGARARFEAHERHEVRFHLR